MKELHGQTLSNEIAESDRLAAGIPGQVAAKNILFSKFWAQLKSIFGVNNWSAREYKSSPCIVVYNKAQYILDESVAPLPYISTDFDTELAANIWVALGGGGGGGHIIADSDEQFAQQPVLKFTGAVNVTNGTGETIVEITAQSVTVDATPTDGSTNPVASNGVFDALALKLETSQYDVEQIPVTTALQTNKLLKVNATGDGVDYTAFSNDQVSHVNGLNVSLWGDGEIRPLGARRVNSTTVVAEQAVPIVDMYEPPTATKTALSTNSNWYNPDGTAKAVYVASGGVTGQRFVDENWLYDCFSNFNWIRTFKTNGWRSMYGISSATKILLENTANWSAGVYIGTAITDGYQGQRHYNQSYVFEFVDNFIPVRYSRI